MPELTPEQEVVAGFVKSKYYRMLREALVLQRERVMSQPVHDMFMAGVKEGTVQTLTSLIQSPELTLAFYQERRRQEQAAAARGERVKAVEMPPLPPIARGIVGVGGDRDLI